MEYDFILNADASLANAIRRTMIGWVPSVAIDTVCIKENDCMLSDEIIAHRLGQIPLKLDPGCEINVHKVKLEAVGPRKIYSKDLAFTQGISVVSPKVLILELGINEVIKLTGETEKGVGSGIGGHAKWNVCCGTSYKKLSDDSFQFHCETNGSKTAKETFIEALDIIRADIVRYKKLL